MPTAFEAQFLHAVHYLELAAIADDRYEKDNEEVAGVLKLFDEEWPNIEAGQTFASTHSAHDEGAATLCSDYSDYAAHLIDLCLHPVDRIRWRQEALKAADALSDRRAVASHAINLGNTHLQIGEFERAIEYFKHAQSIYQELNDQEGKGQVLSGFATGYNFLGRPRLAIRAYRQALDIALAAGNARAECHILGNLGTAQLDAGNSRQALKLFKQSLAKARETNDRIAEGNALGNLGNALTLTGEVRRAIRYHEEELEIVRELGNRGGEGTILSNLGTAHFQLGATEEAIKLFKQALTT